MLISANPSGNYREQIESLVMDTLGCDVPPGPITSKIMKMSLYDQDGNAPIGMDNETMAMAVYDTSQAMTKAEFSDKPDANVKLENEQNVMKVLAKISGNE